MEQQQQQQQKATSKPINKILKFLPRATSSVSFQNPPLYSPAKDKRSCDKTHKSNLGIGFSGPMVSLIPSSDGRRKIKNDSNYALVYEPTSPRVSCMGQVKCKQYRKKMAAAAAAANKLPPTVAKPANKFSRTTSSFAAVRTQIYKEDDHEKSVTPDLSDVKSTKKKSGFRGLFRGGSVKAGRKSDATNNKSKTTTEMSHQVKAPCLNTMKRFSSGRDAFSNFDWTTQVAPLDSAHRNYFTDDERCGGSDGDDDVVKIPSSAPVMERTKGVCDDFIRVGGVNLEPRKEINLWKRRTMAQPKPLQLKTT